MLELGGVPTEDRFRKLTEIQWAFIIRKFLDMKLEKYDNNLSMIEYLAQMVSPSPEGVNKVIAARRKKMDKMREENQEEIVTNNEGKNVKQYSIDGEIVNTSFDDAIREAMGDSGNAEFALKTILGNDYTDNPTAYTVDKRNIDALKNHDDLAEKMGKIIQQSQVATEKEGQKLLPEEIAALKETGFDTISF
jgi:hypothetical protein